MQDMGAEYAVLVPLVEGEEGLELLFEVRAATLSRQPGEVCFPGGRMERGETPAACALRESWEELAIPPARVELLAELDWVVHQSGFFAPSGAGGWWTPGPLPPWTQIRPR